LSPAWSLLILPLAAVIIGVVFGGLMETSLMQRIYSKDPILQLLVTFSAFMIFEDFQRLVWGTQPYFVSDIVNYLGTTEVLGITYTRYQLMLLPGVAIAVFIALRSFLKFSSDFKTKICCQIQYFDARCQKLFGLRHGNPMRCCKENCITFSELGIFWLRKAKVDPAP
jgi:hypothetical protein